MIGPNFSYLEDLSEGMDLKNDEKLDQDVKGSLAKIMEEVKIQYPSR